MGEFLEKLDKFFDDLFLKKMPPLPQKAKEWLIKALPWLVLAFCVLALWGIMASWRLQTAAASYWLLAGRLRYAWFINLACGIGQLIIQAMAISFLFKQKKKGWQLLFWAILLGIAGNILTFSLVGILMSGVSLYFLYQIKEGYR